ncbi:hypothetical protein ACFL5L_00125 [candidate division KSB1 bacterium]
MSGEIQHTPRGFLSFFRKTTPDIIADAPYRIEPDRPLPLVCYVKLNSPFPVTIESVAVKISRNKHTVLSTTPMQQPVTMLTREWQRVFIIPLPDDMTGLFTMDVYIRIEYKGKRRTIVNNSFRGLRNVPLEIFRAKDPIPRFKGFHFGDIHFHNYMSNGADESDVQFPVAAEVARSVGLDFYGAARHSFNKNNSGNAKEKDWIHFNKEIDLWNSEHDTIVLPAEEISCRNDKGRNVQILAVNGEDFIVGTGNTPGKILPGKSEHSMAEVLNRIGSNAAAFALHPVRKKSGILKMLSRSGKWRNSDLAVSGLTGLQVHEILSDQPGNTGLDTWIGLLLKGVKRYIAAGSHASGSLNRRYYRRFSHPGSKNDTRHIFGYFRTGILSTRPLNKDVIVSCLKKGLAVVTNGPLLNFVVLNESGSRALLGSEIKGAIFNLKYRALSTEEFGPIRKVLIYAGDISSHREELIYTFNFHTNSYSGSEEINIEPRSEFGYIRGELWSENANGKYFCFTNPVWIRSSLQPHVQKESVPD